MERKLLLCLLAPALIVTLAGSSCGSFSKQEGEGADMGTPTQSAPSGTATVTLEDDIDSTVRGMIFDYIHFDDIVIERTVYYTDSSGTDWVRFDIHVPDALTPEAWEYGFMKKAPGDNWELVNLGAGDIQCGVPEDVQTGLGFGACPASEEELDRAIKAYLLSGPALTIEETDLRISGKAYYVDSSGTKWVRFSMLPIPHVTAATYGIMKKVAAGNWEGVGFGSAAVECGLPEDVQTGLGFPYCPHG